jgi:excisionase family DNA binding protein
MRVRRLAVMTAETVRLSIADAAARLGISTDTVRRKLKRGQLRAQRDNHGQWWVELSADAKAAEPMQRAAYEPTHDPAAALVDELRSQISRLRMDLDAAYARETAERERHAGQIAGLETLLATERDRSAEQVAALRSALEALKGALDAEKRASLVLRENRDRWYAEATAPRGWWPWKRRA